MEWENTFSRIIDHWFEAHWYIGWQLNEIFNKKKIRVLSSILVFLSLSTFSLKPSLKLEDYPAGSMERVCGQFIDTMIGTVVQKLQSFSTDEIGRLWNVNDDLQNLKQSRLMIRYILEDAETKQVTDKSVQFWLMKLEAVAFDADHVLDQINYHLLQNKLGQQVSLLHSTFDPITFRHRIAIEIMEIEKRIKSINEEAKGLGLLKRKRIPADGDGIDMLSYLESDSFSVDPVFIGREDDVAKIVTLVRNPSEEVVYVLPIVGMAGSGKTTLIRNVYNHANIISKFESNRFWVHVSQNSFDPVVVLKSIVASATGENVVGSRQFVLQKLQKMLGDKQYLLVLDNVWNEDNNMWENFMSSLKGISSRKGNVILITTRNRNVANIVKTLDIHELELLSEEDSWLIIKAKAFGGKYVPLMFETVGKKIAKRCGGLPLAAHVVGSMLHEKSKDEWVSIEKNWISSSEGDGNIISKIVKLSFDYLPSHLLKKCFALFSIFPKGYPIQKNLLISLWMADGLLQTNEDVDMEVVGNKVSSILQQSSLVQVVKKSNGYRVEEFYEMHDLVYDLASSILNSTSLDGSQQVRYMCRPSTDEPPKGQAKCLRTLFFGGEISHEMFSNFKCLHTLILEGNQIKELPNEIGKLISLRVLYINLTRIKCLPESIGKLYLLQTLITPECVEKLPDTLRFLISLRHIRIPRIKLPPEIGSLTSLRILPYFEVGDEEGCGIGELGKLKNLKGAIDIHKLEKVCDEKDAKSADLFHKTNLLKLKFVWSESRADYEKNDENVLEGLQPHWNLEILKIIGFQGRKFPLWTLRMAVREDARDPWIGLDNLVEIELSDCVECEEIPTMGHLPRLKSLCLSHLSNIKSMSSSFYGIKKNGANNVRIVVFPALEKLELINMENLVTWEDVPDEVIVFSCLECLKIENCRQLKSSPSYFPCLKKLEVENMESVEPLENILSPKLISLTILKIHSVDGLVCVTDELFNKNRDLVELEIRNCKNLSEMVLPCLGGGGATLRTLVIAGCPNLESIAYPSSTQLSSKGFTSLRRMEFLCCDGLTNLPCEMLESCALSLETLWLSGSQSLTNLPEVMSIVRNMPRLINLGISFVPKLPEVVAEIESLGSLQELGIGGYSDCMEYDSFNVILDRISPALQSLRILILSGMEEWDAIPGQLQNLTTLHELVLSFFGIEMVPEWFERLSSLRILALLKCKKLRQLPSKKAMQGLTRLEIAGCPLLKEKVEEGSNVSSEWSKVSHIPYIEVDGLPFSPHAQV